MQRYPELYPQEEDNESSSQAESNSGSGPAAPAEGSALSVEIDSTPAGSAPESTVSPDSTSPTDG